MGKEETDTLYVRGITTSNLEFLEQIVKHKGLKYAKDYLNPLLERQKNNYNNRKKQLRENKTYRRKP